MPATEWIYVGLLNRGFELKYSHLCNMMFGHRSNAPCELELITMILHPYFMGASSVTELKFPFTTR